MRGFSPGPSEIDSSVGHLVSRIHSSRSPRVVGESAGIIASDWYGSPRPPGKVTNVTVSRWHSSIYTLDHISSTNYHQFNSLFSRSVTLVSSPTGKPLLHFFSQVSFVREIPAEKGLGYTIQQSKILCLHLEISGYIVPSEINVYLLSTEGDLGPLGPTLASFSKGFVNAKDPRLRARCGFSTNQTYRTKCTLCCLIGSKEQQMSNNVTRHLN